MFFPIAGMVLFMPLSLWITGDGDLSAGSGSTSVLWSVMFGLAVAWIMLRAQGVFTVEQLTEDKSPGAGALVPLQ